MKPKSESEVADIIDDYRHDWLGAMGALTVGFAMQLETFVGLKPYDAAAIVSQWLMDSACAHDAKMHEIVSKDAESATKN